MHVPKPSPSKCFFFLGHPKSNTALQKINKRKKTTNKNKNKCHTVCQKPVCNIWPFIQVKEQMQSCFNQLCSISSPSAWSQEGHSCFHIISVLFSLNGFGIKPRNEAATLLTNTRRQDSGLFTGCQAVSRLIFRYYWSPLKAFVAPSNRNALLLQYAPSTASAPQGGLCSAGCSEVPKTKGSHCLKSRDHKMRSITSQNVPKQGFVL